LREMLQGLTYGGRIDPVMRFIPTLWKGTVNPKIAEAAGFLYRTAAISYAEGREDFVNSSLREAFDVFTTNQQTPGLNRFAEIENRMKNAVAYADLVSHYDDQ